MEKKEKKGFVMPDTYVIIFILLVLAALMTWLLPAGKFDLAEDGKTVLAGTYHAVESNPAGFGDFLKCFLQGLKNASTTIFLVFLIGGAFRVLQDTGAVDTSLAAAIRKTQGNYKVVFPVVMIFMALLGSTGSGNNVALGFVPIMLIMSEKLGLDRIVAVAVLYVASNTGWSTSAISGFSTLLGQEIAGLQKMSGFTERIIFFGIAYLYAVCAVLYYCKRIKKDPSKAIAPFAEAQGELKFDAYGKLTVRQIICLLIMVGCIGVYAWGGVKLGWGLDMLAAVMIFMAVSTGIVGGLTPNQISASFVAGAKSMVYAGFITGFASAISVLLTDANVIHTVVHYLTIPLSYLSSTFAAIGMFVANLIINFFINSGSAQCYVVMPIMAPMSDLLDVSRQIAVSAFQFGDGVSNIIFPTSGLMMGMISSAGIPYTTWLKFALKYTLGLFLLCCGFLAVMTAINWV